MIPFGPIPGGGTARLFTLANAAGFRAEISDYGGTLVRLFAPDRHGRLADVTLGFDRLADYLTRSPYFGCIVGRYGNRIAGGRFQLGGQSHVLATNNVNAGIPCHLHGGVRGFDKVRWQAEVRATPDGPALRLQHRSPHLDEGYPGNLDVTVTYTVTADHSLRLEYTAQTDRPTPVNLTNHAYFNLAGAGAGDVLSHVVTLRARRFTPVDAGLIPVGTIADVAGTPLDFTRPHAIGERINAPHEQLRFAGGYDHNFVLDRAGAGLVPAATVYEPASGRVLEVETTEPGVQFYTGNFLDGSLHGKGGHVYGHRHGFCLETQHFPDSPNQPSFPSTILVPGLTLHSTTVYRFSVR